MEDRLAGKIAIVTGGARGIGFAVSERLCGSGAAVVVADRDQAACGSAVQRLAAQGAAALGVSCELTSAQDREKLINQAIREFGRVDILVNNAGVGGREAPILDISESEWDLTLDVDLKALYFLSQAVVSRMRAQGCKPGSAPYRIINMASAAGIKAPKYASVYGVAKAGVIHLTKIMANEWARYGVVVNAIAPGYVYTDMTKDVMADEKNAAVVKRMIALRRFAMPEEIAGAAEFFASPAAEYITGVTLPVDGGMTLN